MPVGQYPISLHAHIALSQLYTFIFGSHMHFAILHLMQGGWAVVLITTEYTQYTVLWFSSCVSLYVYTWPAYVPKL